MFIDSMFRLLILIASVDYIHYYKYHDNPNDVTKVVVPVFV